MADPAHPWPHNDFITIENLSESILNNDFVAIKVGDVNNTVVANANQIVSRNAHDVLLVSCTGQLVAEGQTIDVTLKIPEDVIGFQWTLETSGLEFESVTSEDIAIDDSHIGVLGNGIVTTSWNGVLEGPDPDRGVEIKIRWKALQSGNLQEMMRMTNSVAQAEAYRADGEIMDVKLVFGTTSQIEFALFQNTPNPWSDHTVIGFNLPEENVALLTLYDMTGKVLKTIEGVFDGGYNEISLVSKELPSGVLYYRLESGSYSASKKMVLIR